MTSPTSAPPPMVPDAGERAIKCIGRHIRLSESVERSIAEAYRDGWNAALAAQPPKPAPQTAAEMTREVFRNWLDKRPAILNALADEGLADMRSTPPQPGDAERLADRLREEIRLGVETQFDEACTQHEDVIEQHALVESIEEQLRHSGFFDALDATQSALAEQRQIAKMRHNDWRAVTEERNRLQSALAESRAEVERLKADYAKLYDQFAKISEEENLRSPTATVKPFHDPKIPGMAFCGICHKVVAQPNGMCLSCEMKQEAKAFDDNLDAQLDRFEEAVGAPTATGEDTETARDFLLSVQRGEAAITDLVALLAAARAQGVREGIEKAANEVERLNSGGPLVARQLADELRSLTTPEPQEEKL